MTTIITVHSDAGERLRRDTERLVELAVDLVQPLAGRIPLVQVVLTDPRGMGQRAVAAYVLLAGAPLRSRQLDNEVTAFTRLSRTSDGLSIPAPDGGALVLLNTRLNYSALELAKPVLHELVHAAQFERPGVRDRVTAHVRRAYGLASPAPREEAVHDRLMDSEEREAYRLENRASDLIRVFTAARQEAVR